MNEQLLKNNQLSKNNNNKYIKRKKEQDSNKSPISSNLLDKYSSNLSDNTKRTSKKNKSKSSNESYKISINSNNNHIKDKNKLYSNRIESSKYTWFNIIPKILLEQFSNVGNVYFLVLAIIQLIPNISNSGSTPINFVPLTIVVLVNGLKDAIEDYKRKKADYAENNTKAKVLIYNNKNSETNYKNSKKITKKKPNSVDNEGFTTTEWKRIKPGEIVKINKNETFPADLLLIYSSNPKGVAYVETKSLDGETNLKLKESVKTIYDNLKNINKDNNNNNNNNIKNYLSNISGDINADFPNDKMFKFNGTIKHEINNDNSKDNKDTREERLESVETFENNAYKLDTDRFYSTNSINNNANKKNSNCMNKDKLNPIELDNLLLRGSVLMQTDYVYAIVVYVGHSTKIMLNSLSARSKQSKLSKLMNHQLTKVLFIQMYICIFASIINMSEYFNNGMNDSSKNVFLKAIIIFLTWVLNLQNIIPISLVVTLEMIKFCQAMFINWDVKIYDRKLKKRTSVQSSSLNEELGQISNIFTDKTGTLTKNYMQLRCLIVKDKRYGDIQDLDLESKEVSDVLIFNSHNHSNNINEDNNDEKILSKNIKVENKTDNNYFKQESDSNIDNDCDNKTNIKMPHVKFSDSEFTEEVEKIKSNKDSYNKEIKNLLLALSLCHTAISEKIDDKKNKNIEDEKEKEKEKDMNNSFTSQDYDNSLNSISNSNKDDNDNNTNTNTNTNKYNIIDKLKYNASSPDELALVYGARYFGAIFVDRTEDNNIVIDWLGSEKNFKLLNIFEFNSDRKRMSIVFKDEENKIYIITKGADSVIKKIIKNTKNNNNFNIDENLEFYGKKGLRTLLFAQREVTEEEYNNFKDAYNNALNITNNSRQEKIDKSYNLLEKDLEFLGGTAIEDALQDDLRLTLTNLRKAGIKLWMLTGDNPLTAVSIAHSSGLIDHTFTPIILKSTDLKEIASKLIEIADSKNNETICLVVTGDTLLKITNIKNKEGIKKLFALALSKVKCFIGCRVSPKQKAEIVLIVKKEFPDKCNMAIGDGANDVNMINAADVGIGIMGVEGTQAARASDYAIGSFSYLQRLMFIHGRESYRKNSFAVGYMLWKNFLYSLPQIFIGFSSQFSGINLYDPYIDILYNLLFTAFPIGWFSIYDKEYQYKFLENSPRMYTPGIKSIYFNTIVFWKWYLYAIFLAGFIYLSATTVLTNTIGSNLKSTDLSALGATIYFNIVLFVNFKLMISTHSYELAGLLVQTLSILSYFLILYLTSNFTLFQTYGNWSVLLYNNLFFLQSALIIIVGLLMEYAFRSINFFVYELFLRHNTKLGELATREEEMYKDEEDLKREKKEKDELNDSSLNEDMSSSLEEEDEEEKEELEYYDNSNYSNNNNKQSKLSYKLANRKSNISKTNSSENKRLDKYDLSVKKKTNSKSVLIYPDKVIIGKKIFNFKYSKDMRTDEEKDYLERKKYTGFAYIGDNANSLLLKNKLENRTNSM